MRYTIISIILALFVAVSAHAATLSSEFTTLVREKGLSPTYQAACVDGPSSTLTQNAAMRIIPASVSKLYTFDWALSTLPIDFTYNTDFYVSGTTLYINGGGDPHFVIEHLRSVLQKIAIERNVTITRVVFSPNFYFNWKSTPADVTTALKASLLAERTTLPVSRYLSVSYSTKPYSGRGTHYEFHSAPLPALLKQINDYSTNISTDVLFRRLGGSAAFSQYMAKTYGVGPKTVYFSTGSGLYGNFTTCDLTIRVMKHLEAQMKKNNLALTDVMSVPTIDPGVLSKRHINSDDALALVAKSGTLNNHQSLAGIINTKKGSMYFAVFTDFPNVVSATAVKGMIDEFVSTVLRTNRDILRHFDYAPDTSYFKQFEVVRA